MNGVAEDLVLIACKSFLIDNKIFEDKNYLTREMKIGITSLEAAIDFDNYSRKRFAEYDTEILAMRDKLNKLERQMIFFKVVYRMGLIPVVIKILKKVGKIIINFLKKGPMVGNVIHA